MVDRRDRLQLLGLVDSEGSALQAIIDRHGILIGKLIAESGLGNILYGIEAPSTDVSVHADSASAHHVKYTDANAVDAVQTDGATKQETYIPFGNEPEAGVTIFPT